MCLKWMTNKNLLYKKINKIKFKKNPNKLTSEHVTYLRGAMSETWGRVRGRVVTEWGQSAFVYSGWGGPLWRVSQAQVQWSEGVSPEGCLGKEHSREREKQGQSRWRGSGDDAWGVVFGLCFRRAWGVGSLGLSSRTQMYFWLFMLQWSILALNLGKGRDWGWPTTLSLPPKCRGSSSGCVIS